MFSARVMAIANHPDVLPNFALENIAIVLNRDQKLGSEKGLCDNILGGQIAIRGTVDNDHGCVALEEGHERGVCSVEYRLSTHGHRLAFALEAFVWIDVHAVPVGKCRGNVAIGTQNPLREVSI